MNDISIHETWMRAALFEANAAAKTGEVPVGAVLVKDEQIIGRGSNCPISSSDPTAHAEIIALRRGAEKLQNYRLPGTTLYVTLEPCIMCMGAIIHARVEKLIIGATDPKSGAAYSVYNIGSDGLLNHTLVIETGVLEEACRKILKDFFRVRRAAKKKGQTL